MNRAPVCSSSKNANGASYAARAGQARPRRECPQMAAMWILRAITATQKRRAQRSSAAAQNNKGHESENYRSHHHDRKAIGGFYEIQEGLDLGTGITRGRLLHLVKHCASYFCPSMKNGQR